MAGRLTPRHEWGRQRRPACDKLIVSITANPVWFPVFKDDKTGIGSRQVRFSACFHGALQSVFHHHDNGWKFLFFFLRRHPHSICFSALLFHKIHALAIDDGGIGPVFLPVAALFSPTTKDTNNQQRVRVPARGRSAGGVLIKLVVWMCPL